MAKLTEVAPKPTFTHWVDESRTITHGLEHFLIDGVEVTEAAYRAAFVAAQAAVTT